MTNKTLYILCGVPASGKTTWAKKEKPNAIYISRDIIRFNLLKDGEDYFSHENEVFNIFVSEIQRALTEGQSNEVIANATHISQASRNKLLDRLNLINVDIIPVCFWCDSFARLIERNDKREGREVVPRSALKNMFYKFIPPANNEKYKYKEIINIKT